LLELQLKLPLLHCTHAQHAAAAGKTQQTLVVQQLRAARTNNSSSSSSSGLAAESDLAATRTPAHVLHIQRTRLFLQGVSLHESDRWAAVISRVRIAATAGETAAALQLVTMLLLVAMVMVTAAVMAVAGAGAGVAVEVVMIDVTVGVMTEGSEGAAALSDGDTMQQ
jgi:hypothetical protein